MEKSAQESFDYMHGIMRQMNRKAELENEISLAEILERLDRGYQANNDNVIKVSKIRREGFTEYRAEVRSVFAVSDFQSQHIPDEFVAATLVNQLREFVNSSVLGECIETEYRKLGDKWTCPLCGAEVGK